MSGEGTPIQLRVADVLGLQSFHEAHWEMLTPRADVSSPVRWVHAIDDPRPAALLQGQEFVLSTLSRFTEDAEDLIGPLRAYVEELDTVEASALAVEVLPDRPRLLEALRALAAERGTPSADSLPMVLFTEQVRFVDITEDFHQSLMAQHLAQEPSADAADPLFEVSTQLIRDVIGGHLTSAEQAAQRGQPLGVSGAAQYRTLVLRFRSGGRISPAERTRAKELIVQAVRTALTESSSKALVGQIASKDIGIVLALAPGRQTAPETDFCLALEHAVARTRGSGLVPAFDVASGEPRSTLLRAITELESAQQVLRSLGTILPRADRFPRIGHSAAERRYWRASDLGVLGLLARVEDQEAVEWFHSAQLGRLRGVDDTQELCEMIRALASPTSTKSEVAAVLGISRPTLYSRIRRVERLLGRELDDDLIRTLHAALLVEDLFA